MLRIFSSSRQNEWKSSASKPASQQGAQRLVANRLPDRGTCFRQIGFGPPIDPAAQDQVVGRIPDHRKLGITAFVVAFLGFRAFGVVDRDVPGFQAGRVDGSQRGPLSQNLPAAALDVVERAWLARCGVWQPRGW
jgi:hypothetical protein